MRDHAAFFDNGSVGIFDHGVPMFGRIGRIRLTNQLLRAQEFQTEVGRIIIDRDIFAVPRNDERHRRNMIEKGPQSFLRSEHLLLRPPLFGRIVRYHANECEFAIGPHDRKQRSCHVAHFTRWQLEKGVSLLVDLLREHSSHHRSNYGFKFRPARHDIVRIFLKQSIGGLSIIVRCRGIHHDMLTGGIHQCHGIGRILNERLEQRRGFCKLSLRASLFSDVVRNITDIGNLAISA